MVRGLGKVRQTDPGGRSRVPTGRGKRLAGLMPVVRQQRGALVELVALDVLDHPRHGGMAARPPLAQL